MFDCGEELRHRVSFQAWKLFAETQPQARLAALCCFLVAALLFRSFQQQRPDGFGLFGVFIYSHKGYIGRCGVFALASEDLLGENFYAYFHGRMEDTIDLRFENDQLAEIYGIAKIDIVHGSGDDVTVGVTAGGHGRGHVHQMHDLAAEQFAERIGLRGKDYFRHLRARGADGLGLQKRIVELRRAGEIRFLLSHASPFAAILEPHIPSVYYGSQ
jgi:hypothetical protein